jgi:5,10-methylenetetrahydromethanopterin reductase
LFVTLTVPDFAKEFPSVSYLFWGTILDEDEDPGSDRVRAAGGPGLALAYHGAYEFGTPLDELPGGPEWQAVVERTPPEERHLAVHEQHCVGLNEADQAAWNAGGHAMLEEATISGTAGAVRERLAGLAEQGITELVFQPCGPDIRRELEVFANTARSAVAA